MIRASDLKFTGVRYHRNGCTGAGFYVVVFTDASDAPIRFLRAVVFEGEGVCAVTDADYRATYRGGTSLTCEITSRRKTLSAAPLRLRGTI